MKIIEYYLNNLKELKLIIEKDISNEYRATLNRLMIVIENFNYIVLSDEKVRQENNILKCNYCNRHFKSDKALILHKNRTKHSINRQQFFQELNY